MENNQQIFGIRAIIEALEAGQTIDKVFIQKELQGDLAKKLLRALKTHQVNFSYVPVEKLAKFDAKNHQGAMAQIAPINFVELEPMVEAVLESGKTPLFLMLDQISDARNFGAIIRTAACIGVDGIIIPKTGSAPVNADTVKTSAGGVFHVPICKVNHLKDAIYFLQASGIQVVAATEKAEKTLYQADLKSPTAIIMGSEDRGINPSVLAIIDQKVKLPMVGQIGSLNVSVACGAFLYECLRQRA
jgi:23S rRNA (guanosine2251-2'-O)-methyltransferase